MSRKLLSQGVTYTAVNTQDPTRRVVRLYNNVKENASDEALAYVGKLFNRFTPGDVTDSIRLRPVYDVDPDSDQE